MNLQTIFDSEALESALQSYEGIAHHLFTTAIFINKIADQNYARLRQTELSNILVTMTLIWSIKKFSSKNRKSSHLKVNDANCAKRTESELRKKELL